MTAETRRAVWIGLGQVALVLLSVGLGLAIGEWRQRAADAERARLAMDAAVREMATNRARVESALDHHLRLLDRLSGEDAGAGIQLRPAFISDNAWETAQSAGVVPMLPFPVIDELAQVHEVQEVYLDLAKMNVQLLYFGNVFSGDALPSNLRGFASSIGDLRAFEETLLRRYAAAFAALDASGFAVADSLLTPPTESHTDD